jgi:hypothetical protein
VCQARTVAEVEVEAFEAISLGNQQLLDIIANHFSELNNEMNYFDYVSFAQKNSFNRRITSV